ncbi:MAG: alpha-L-fucosidase [Gemmatimonadetes bacterium]|nr:alpha-L-fucosidase [Gemmatimonadota bacterium]
MTIDRRHFLAASAAAIPALRGLQPRLTVAPSADRMAWWREARFGMFLHWGLYSILAGKWKDDDRWAEWIRHNAKIPIDEYDQLRARWNPTGFDPDQWAHMAQRAGMRYAVLTTKHHDGFCLFDSKATDFDVMQTPSARDICRDLAPALRKRGIRVGWYHSIMDWHHPDYLPRRDWEAATRPASEAQFARYVTYLETQIDELLTNYGGIDVLWFDGQWEATWTHQLALELEQRIRRRAPHIVINDRINGSGTPKGVRLGDFGTPENEVPATGTPERDWESCMTMNENWGYKAKDQNWKSPQKLVELLVETASKGGNLLLNVGPMADGRFPAPAIERLEAVGAWMAVHSSAIYGSRASRFAKPVGFRATTQARRCNLFLTSWPSGLLPLPGLRTMPTRVELLGTPGAAVRVVEQGAGLALEVPATAPAGLLPCVVLHFADDWQVITPRG